MEQKSLNPNATEKFPSLIPALIIGILFAFIFYYGSKIVNAGFYQGTTFSCLSFILTGCIGMIVINYFDEWIIKNKKHYFLSFWLTYILVLMFILLSQLHTSLNSGAFS